MEVGALLTCRSGIKKVYSWVQNLCASNNVEIGWVKVRSPSLASHCCEVRGSAVEQEPTVAGQWKTKIISSKASAHIISSTLKGVRFVLSRRFEQSAFLQ